MASERKILFRGGIIVNAGGAYEGDLLVENGKISDTGRNIGQGAGEVVDVSGKFLFPGGIDVHTHLDLPFGGTVSNDDFFTGHMAAAFGGTTSHIDFAIQTPGETLTEAVDRWHEKADGKAVIDYGFHLAVTDFNDAVLAELPTMRKRGITSLKVFMAYKGLFQVSDEDLFQTLRIARDSGMLVMVHAENGDVIDVLVREAHEKGNLAPKYHALTRPPEAEGEATGRAIAVAEMAGAPIYIVHLTCALALNQVRRARSRGLPAYAETCPQYLYKRFEDYELRGFEGAKVVMSPPIRSADNWPHLWQGLADDTLQVVSTDHCPFCFDGQKDLGKDDFSKIPNGAPGIEDRMMVMYHGGVNEGRYDVSRFVEITSANPAKLFGLFPRKGALLPGSDADIVVWDPEKEKTISAKTHHMNVDYSLYEGMKVKGVPVRVYRRGELLVDGDTFHGEKGSGVYLERGVFTPV